MHPCIIEQTSCPNNLLHAELNRVAVVPTDAAERYVAQRALVRYEKLRDSDVATVCASEDWVRLFIALRRVHPHHTRITLALLKQWKTKATSFTSDNKEVLYRGDGGP